LKTKGLALEPRTYRTLVAPPAATLEDASRFRNDGAITGATWVRLPSGFWVLDFDPTAPPDYVLIPAAHTQLDFTSEDFSIIARVRIDSLASHRVIFNRGLQATDGYRFIVISNGQFDLWTNGGGIFQRS